MNHPIPNITVNVDITNPGQFFASRSLLELADRLWPGAEGWFEVGVFCINAEGTLTESWCSIIEAELKALDPDDESASPMQLSTPFELTLAWWKDEHAGGRRLKVWAASMRAVPALRAQQHDGHVRQELDSRPVRGPFSLGYANRFGVGQFRP